MRGRFRRMVILLLCAALLSTQAGLQSVSEEIRETELLIVNPLYKDIIDEASLAREIEAIRARESRQEYSAQAYSDSEQVYSTVKEAASGL